MKFTETQRTTTQVFKGKLLDVRLDTVELPDGRTATREYILHQGAVVMIPVLPDGKIVLVKQFRYPIGRVMIEFPAGKLDPGEDYLTTAERELKEEIGYRPGRMTLLGELEPCVGYSNERMGIVLAEDLTADSVPGDEDEWIEVMPVTFDEALSLVWDGSITDSKTVAGLFWYSKVLNQSGLAGK
ncbi:MAG: NUDIX hydrolase [FCB group bacterium]|nr:NUDIX hydrolase [FCB group bacterium]